MKKTVLTFSFFAAVLLWNSETQAHGGHGFGGHSMGGGFHSVNAYHPQYGQVRMSTHEDDVSARHWESRPREEVTGRGVGCDAWGDC